jgi:hypothetical protein
MAAILLFTTGGEDDRRLVLGNERAARKFAAAFVSGGWTSILLGMRFAVSASAQIVSGNLAFGLSNEVTSVYGDQVTNNFVGVRSSPTPNPNFGYSAGPPVTLQQIKLNGVVKIASGETLGADIGGVNDMKISADPSTIRNIFLVQITKGSPNFTVTAGYLNGTNADISQTSFLTAMETAIASINVWNAQYLKGADVTMAVNEGANGALNSACIRWSNVQTSLYISDVAYARVS